MIIIDLPPPEEGIKHHSNSVDAYISQRCLGTGALYIAESRLCWAKEASTERLSLEYPHIAIHAISRDCSNFQFPCLYIMLDINIDSGNEPSNGAESDSDDDDGVIADNPEITEIRFVPSDAGELDAMYKALNECQLLHPDPEDVDEDEDYGYDDAFDEIGEQEVLDGENADYHQNGDVDRMDDEGAADVDFDVDMGQFDDAPDEQL